MGMGGAGGGPLGMISGLVGPLIDYGMNQFFNAITPNPVTEKNRIEEARGVHVEEGAPINVCYGDENRVGGTVIFHSDLIEVKNVENYGGKGFGDNAETIITYSYFVDIAVGICLGPVTGIDKIWANGRLIYTGPATLVLSGFTISCVLQPDIDGLANGLMEIQAPWPAASNEDLSKLIPGYPVTTAGFANGANNGTFQVTMSGVRDIGGGSKISFARLYNLLPAAAAAGPGITCTQQQGGLLNYVAAAVRGYTGSESQAVDPLLQYYGTLQNIQTPAYRGLSYIVIERLALEEFGNAIPTFSFKIRSTVAEPVTEVFRKQAILANVDSTKIFNANATGTIRGLTVSGPKGVVDTLAAPMFAFDIVVVEDEDLLLLYDRNSTTGHLVDSSYLGARESGTKGPFALEIKEPTEESLPTEVNLQYLDSAMDYQRGSQREQIVWDRLTRNVLSFNTPVVLTAGEARTLAARALFRGRNIRRRVQLTLPPVFYRIKPHERISLFYLGFTHLIFVETVTKGYNCLVQIEGYIE